MSNRETLECINPKRIQWCCKQLSMSLAELASELKLSAPKLESAQLTMNQLRQVAKYFGHSIFFFVEKNLPKRTVHSPQFRTIGEQTKFNNNLYKIIKQVERHRDLFIDLLSDAGEPPKFNKPQLNGSIGNKATAVREWLGITANIKYDFDKYRKLVEAKGIFVQQSMGYAGQWQVKEPNSMLGFAINHPSMPTIFITKTSPERQTFTLFHELGHLLLHNNSFFDNEANLNSDATKKNEKEANTFAGHCLVTSDTLKQLTIPNRVEEYGNAFYQKAKDLGISTEVLVVSLLKNKQISHSDYAQFKAVEQAKHRERKREEAIQQQKTEKKPIPRKFRHLEPLHIFGNNYVHTVLDSMQQGDVTLYKASKLLDNIKVTDVQELIGKIKFSK